VLPRNRKRSTGSSAADRSGMPSRRDELAEGAADQERVRHRDVDADAAAQHGESRRTWRPWRAAGCRRRSRSRRCRGRSRSRGPRRRRTRGVLPSLIRRCVEAARETPTLEQRAGHEELSQHVDSGRCRKDPAGRRRRPCESSARTCRIDQMSSIGPGRGPHAAGPRRRPRRPDGRAGAADQPLAVAQHDLALVPTSMNRVSLSVGYMRSTDPAAMSPPT